jgi:Fic family protein
MEPLFPAEGELNDLAVELIGKASALGSSIHPITRHGLTELVEVMNSYYSNLIEGNTTHPIDIERALKEDYSTEPAKRALQLESAAHVKVQGLIDERLKSEPQGAYSSSYWKKTY